MSVEAQESEQEFDPFAEQKEPQARKSGGLAWLALLAALAVGGWNGWQWWQARGEENLGTEQAQSIENLRTEQSNLAGQFGELEDRQQSLEDSSLAAEVEELGAGLDRLQARVARTGAEQGLEVQRTENIQATQGDLQQRLTAAEAALAALAVRGESPGKRIELAEVDFLLRTANERLQLFGDTRGAAQALSLADGQLAALDDLLYLPVRQAIAAAQLAIADLPKADKVALTQGLAHLQAQIPAWPFSGEAIEDHAGAEAIEAAEAGIWDRFLASMSSLVTVRRRVEEDQLISLEDKDFLRQGLWLQLESARLALMRSDQEAYQSSLARANATLEQYFDQEAQTVLNARSEIERLAGVQLVAQMPDISQPWAILNSLRSDTAMPPAPPLEGEQDDPGAEAE